MKKNKITYTHTSCAYNCYYDCYIDGYNTISAEDQPCHPFYSSVLEVHCKSKWEGLNVNGKIWLPDSTQRKEWLKKQSLEVLHLNKRSGELIEDYIERLLSNKTLLQSYQAEMKDRASQVSPPFSDHEVNLEISEFSLVCLTKENTDLEEQNICYTPKFYRNIEEKLDYVD